MDLYRCTLTRQLKLHLQNHKTRPSAGYWLHFLGFSLRRQASRSFSCEFIRLFSGHPVQRLMSLLHF